jgi:hypothetical protein
VSGIQPHANPDLGPDVDFDVRQASRSGERLTDRGVNLRAGLSAAEEILPGIVVGDAEHLGREAG